MTSQSLWSRYDRHFVGITRYTVLSWIAKIYRVNSNKIESVSFRKCPYDYWLTNKAYASAITVTNISNSFTYKMATKINCRICGTELCRCHPIRIVFFSCPNLWNLQPPYCSLNLPCRVSFKLYQCRFVDITDREIWKRESYMTLRGS